MAIELSQLYYFCEVAKTEHITRAASNCHITQPALSKIIAKMERELGTELFDREGKNIHLNSYGRIVYEHALNILNEVNLMQEQLQSELDAASGSIHIASSYPVRGSNWLSQMIWDFAAIYPEIFVSFSRMDSLAIQDAMLHRKLNFAITTFDITVPGIDCVPFFKEPMGVLMSVDNDLAKADELHVADLRNEKFLCITTLADDRRFATELCRKAGFEANFLYISDFITLIDETLLTNKGVSFLSPSLAAYFMEENYSQNGLVYKELKDDFCVYVCYFCSSTSSYQSPIVKKFHQYIMKHYQKYVPGGGLM